MDTALAIFWSFLDAGRLDGLGLGAMLLGTLAVWSFASWFWRVWLRSYIGASA